MIPALCGEGIGFCPVIALFADVLLIQQLEGPGTVGVAVTGQAQHGLGHPSALGQKLQNGSMDVRKMVHWRFPL